MSYGVKTSISVNLGFLFLFAMAVTAFSALTLVKQVMVKKEVERAYHLAQTVGELAFDQEGRRNMAGIRFAMGHVVEGSAVTLVKLSIPGDDLSYGFGNDPRLAEAEKAINETIETNEPVVKHLGSSPFISFGGAVVVAAPLTGAKRGGVGIVVSTDVVEGWLSGIVKILSFYIVINLLVVTFAGVWQVSKVALRPVNRLLAKAEDVESVDGALFHDEVGSEFSRLSMALNAMISRINEDRKKLKKSVQELEVANADLKKAQQEVVRAEKLAAMGRLASGVAHEIGNPLGIVTGYLALMKGADTPEERDDFIHRTEEELSRIDGIIRQLLDFNRNGNSGEKGAVSVHGLVEEVQELVRVQPMLKEIYFTTELEAEEDGVLSTDGELRQVFMNMVLNAADAIEAAEVEKGHIHIRTRKPDDDHLEVVVEDNGGGISQKVLGNVFDPFFTTKDPGEGTGLGLSVSFMIVEGLGGSLRAESREGDGTQMIMEFPVAKTSQSKA